MEEERTMRVRREEGGTVVGGKRRAREELPTTIGRSVDEKLDAIDSQTAPLDLSDAEKANAAAAPTPDPLQ